MFIEHLETFHFRNLERLSLDFAPRAVLLRGPNAHGKTNLLEAIYLCATGKSFRSGSPGEMLRHGEEGGRVKARFSRDGVRHEVEVQLGPRRRTVRVDDRGLRQAAKLLELVNVVAFFPDDLRIVKGSPEERRRFLDRAIANHRPDFVTATLSYQKALKARNAVLKNPGRWDPTLLSVYDQELITHGAVIHQCRVDVIAELSSLVQAGFREIMQTDLELGIGLESGLKEAGSFDDFAEAFTQALQDSVPRDRARGITSLGPHRADLVLALNEHPARQFASQGQQRALVLALKLAEVTYLRKRLGCAPILLLDDVSSELDTERSRHLFQAVAALESQVWITSTGAAPLQLPEKTQFFSVQGGLVSPSGP